MHNYFLFLNEYRDELNRLHDLEYTTFPIQDDWEHSFPFTDSNNSQEFEEFFSQDPINT